MKKGILYAFLIYIVGFGIAGLVFLIFGHPYIHAPGLHHIIIFLTFITGVIVLIAAILAYFLKKKSKKLQFFIISNLIIIFSFAIYVWSIIYVDNGDDDINIQNNTVSTEYKGDTTYVYHNGNIVYIQVKDSVLLNFMENIKLEE
jgi:hypothetical protein